ncbi:MAG TPA: hypothetical protein VHO01_14255 [Jatrophihabitans sp.]|nr:hypothetical protein [Jatrophihabitans sp.]
MTGLPEWTFGGDIADANDLSELEAALHSGRVSAAERGYTGEPRISTEPVMVIGEPDQPGSFLTEDEATSAGRTFEPTGIRYRMVWAAE